MTNILNFVQSNWTLDKATIVDKSITLQVGGSATFTITDLILSAVPDSLVFIANPSVEVDAHKPLIYGIFSAMYANPVDSITQELQPRNGISILLPITNEISCVSKQEQLKYTECNFTIYNKSSKEVVLTDIALLRSDIKYDVYVDEDGYLNSNKTTYTLEIGHTLGDGTFYFNRSYVDEPYYTAPNNPSVVITPITNAADKYIGGKVTNANEQKVFVVCYCVIPGD